MSRTALECYENSMKHDHHEHAHKAVRLSFGAVRMLKTKRCLTTVLPAITESQLTNRHQQNGVCQTHIMHLPGANSSVIVHFLQVNHSE